MRRKVFQLHADEKRTGANQAIRLWLGILLVAATALTLAWLQDGNAARCLSDCSYKDFSGGWTDDLTGEAASSAGPLAVGGDGSSVSRTLTAAEAERGCLLLRTLHTDLSVSLDGRVLYTYDCGDSGFSSFPGCVWHLISLPADAAGQTLRLTVRSPLPKYAGVAGPAYLTAPSEAIPVILRLNALQLVLSLLLLFTSLLLLLLGLLFRRFSGSSRMLFLSGFAAALFGWQIADCGLAQFLSGRMGFFSILDYECLVLIPISVLLCYLKTGSSLLRRFCRIALYVLTAYFLLVNLLHLTGVLPLVRTVSPSLFCIVATAAGILAIRIRELTARRVSHPLSPGDIGFAVIFLCVLADVIVYYASHYTQKATFAGLGFVVYIFSMLYESSAALFAARIDREKMEQLERLATLDQLTGLPNRRGLHQFYTQLPPETPVSCMFMDIDNFKLVNDTCGHGAGDDLLVALARMLHRRLPGQFAVRMSGDEFMVILTGPTNDEALSAMAESLLDDIRTYRFSGSVIDAVSLSIGILKDCRAAMPLDELISKADKALYEVKLHGKNGFRIFSAAQLSRAAEHHVPGHIYSPAELPSLCVSFAGEAPCVVMLTVDHFEEARRALGESAGSAIAAVVRRQVSLFAGEDVYPVCLAADRYLLLLRETPDHPAEDTVRQFLDGAGDLNRRSDAVRCRLSARFHRVGEGGSTAALLHSLVSSCSQQTDADIFE